ncbi:shikimate kinase [soil metagenome]
MDNQPKNPFQHLYLLGLMGSGKSRLGKELAKKLMLPFIDLDRYIEEQEGKSINDIFQTEGEDDFRKLEHHYLMEVAALPAAVVSLGGGTPCFFDNMEIIKQTGRSLYLQTPTPILASRLASGKTLRPLLGGKDEAAIRDFLAHQLLSREQYYLQANLTVENNGKLKVGDLVKIVGGNF